MKWIGDFSIVFTEKKCRQAPAHAWSRIDVNLTPPERHPWANHFINVIRCAQIWITNLQVFKVIDNNRPKMFELCLVLHRWLFHGIQLKFHCAKVLIDITYIYIYIWLNPDGGMECGKHIKLGVAKYKQNYHRLLPFRKCHLDAWFLSKIFYLVPRKRFW